jgi:micrococcal nuclease
MRTLTVAACLRVIDGDTILCSLVCPCCRVVSEQRIRLAGIDAPELTDDQPAPGQQAKQYLAAIIEGKIIEVMVTKTWPDRYGRVLGRVYYRGEDICARMILTGHARAYQEGPARSIAP